MNCKQLFTFPLKIISHIDIVTSIQIATALVYSFGISWNDFVTYKPIDVGGGC